MSEISTFLRIVHPKLNDELVTKRETAIKDLSGRFTKDRSIPALFKVADNLVQAVETNSELPEAFATMAESAIHKASKSFVREGNELEMVVCSLLAALKILSSNREAAGPDLTCHDLIAVGLWSGLSFQPARKEPRIEELRALVLDRARTHTLGAGGRTRKREEVATVDLDNFKDFDPATLKVVAEESIKPTIDALRGNAAVDREEIDLLWWALSGWSNVLNRSYEQKGAAAGTAIAVGLEVGRKVRGMPVNAHRQLLLRFVKGATKLDLNELIMALGDEREPLGAIWGSSAHVAACPRVFPLISALSTGEVADTHAGSSTKRTLVDWANLALLESAALQVASKSPRVNL